MILTSLALAAGLVGSCEWTPSEQPAFGGDPASVVDRFQDIPIELRQRLRQRIETKQFDEVVSIRRDAIHGRQQYAQDITGLQLGQNQVCATASRERWAASAEELGLSYCEAAYCMIVGTSGRHVGRTTLRASAVAGPMDPQAELDRAPSAAQPAEPAFVPGRLIVGARAGLSDDGLDKVLKGHGAKGRRIGRSDLHIIDLPGHGNEHALAALLARHPQLKFAELDQRLPAAFAVNDPYAGSQWHLGKIGAQAAWDRAQGTGITIAVIDSGVDATHPDLSARMVPGWNFVDNNSNTADVHGHGTAVAGAAAATLNNGTGVAAVAGGARIMPLRVADAASSTSFSIIAQAITWAADHGARVANVSYGAAGSASVLSAAQYMKSKGGLVIVAAGNDGIAMTTAQTSAVVVVSATASNDAKTSWSSYGAFVTISAPGQDIWTTTRGGGYQAWWGTSLATPVVAGTVGLMMSAKPSLNPSQIESLLYASSTDLGTAGRDALYGWGRVDAAAAVQASLDAVAPDTTPPSAVITSPSASSSVSGLVAVDASASDNVGVARMELRVNGSTVATDSSTPYSFSWDSSKVGNGMNKLSVQAFDAAGNSAGSAEVAVNVNNVVLADTSAPVVAFVAPTAGERVSGTVSISSKASDDRGPASLRMTLLIDGAQVASSTGGTLSYSWNTRKARAGAHAIQVVAQDAAGNKATANISVTK